MMITAQRLHERLLDGGELALVDVREEAEFGQHHLLLAVNLPLSAIELRVATLIPRRDTPVVVCDENGGELCERGAWRLVQLGYGDVAVLQGGTRAWDRAGFQSYSGVNVPSKAFGEFVEHACGTPSISAEELKQQLDGGEDLVVLDSRPLSEFQDMNIPGSTCVPGGELVLRARALAPDPATRVVVNCAGRTRSIIGAQSLINAGLPNPVVALRNGTMGWHLAGLTLEHGQSRYLAEPDAPALEDARAAAGEVARRYGVTEVAADTLAAWRADATRSTFLLDVRTPEEFAAGHLAGAISAPGGQLIQATDRYVGVLNARVVLADDDGVRATMAASWLRQMGLHEVHVLAQRVSELDLVTGEFTPEVLGLEGLHVPRVDATELAPLLATGQTLVLDLSPSLVFRAGHLPGALHAVRGRLAQRLPPQGATDLLVLTAEHDARARLAVTEALGLVDCQVRVLEGGNVAWERAGHALVSGRDGLEEVPCDTFLRAYDRDKDIEQHMQSYLDWEIELIERIARDDTVRFSLTPS
jgi:rhodanese-related sulfurtransferase